MAESPSYLGYYPVAAFLVDDRRALNPLMTRLRQLGRLRTGANVTPFHMSRCRLLSSHCAEDVSCSRNRNANTDREGRNDAAVAGLQPLGLSHAQIEVVETPEAAVSLITRHRVTFVTHYQATSDAPSTSHSRSPLQTHDGNAIDRGAQPAWLHALHQSSQSSAEVSEKSATYFAVHTTGAWSPAELLSILAPGRTTTSVSSPAEVKRTRKGGRATTESAGTAPLAYVHQLRIYSAACMPLAVVNDGSSNNSKTVISPAAIASTPGAKAFLALRRLAIQRSLGASATTTQDASTPSPPANDSFTFSELFAGIGMFRAGLKKAGGTPSFAVEYATPARIVYEHNFHSQRDSITPLAGDITELPSFCFPPHDLLTAGFPCQSFAKAGPATGLHNSRGWLFYEVVRVLHASRPRAFLLENVANLVKVEAGEQLEEILRCLREPSASLGGIGSEQEWLSSQPSPPLSPPSHPLRYAVGFRVVDGAAVTPQSRQRVYFVGIRVDNCKGECDHHATAADCSHTHTCEGLIEDIFDAAAARTAAMGAGQPFRCVRDLLESTFKFRESAAALHPMEANGNAEAMPGAAQALQLTPAQWDAVQRSRTFRQNPSWRLVNTCGLARTLMGSYRTSYQLYSEFLPYPDTLLDLSPEAFCEVLARAATVPGTRVTREEAADDAMPQADVECRGKEEGKLPMSDAFTTAPLRFYSVRECARLQGIPENYQFPVAHEDREHDRSRNAAGVAAADVKASSSQEGARRIPIGAVYKLIGNAVNPLIVECLGRSIAERVFV